MYCFCRWHGGLINGKPAGFQFPRYTLVSYNASKIVLPDSFVQHRGLIKLHPSYFSLHWLPVTYRIEFKILVLTFKAIYQLAPFYICNLVRLKEKCKYQLRSSEELLQLPIRKTKKTPGERSFQTAAPVLWNCLPASVKNIDDFLLFKQPIKT